jgi:iron(III) transport system permease protein
VVLGVGAAALLVLVVLPLAFLVWSSVTAEGRITLDNFRAALSQRLYVQALKNSLILGAWTAVLSVAIGLPMAWAVGRTNVPAKKFIHLTAVVAYVTPPYLTAIAFVYLFSPNAGLLNRFARESLDAPALTFNVFSMSGLVLVRFRSCTCWRPARSSRWTRRWRSRRRSSGPGASRPRSR